MEKWIDIVKDFKISHSNSRFNEWDSEITPEYCFYYEIDYVNIEARERVILWFENKAEILSFLKYELPINYLRRFYRYNKDIKEESIALDFSFFFTNEDNARKKLTNYQNKIDEVINENSFDSFAEILTTAFNDKREWFKSAPKILWIGKTNSLFKGEAPVLKDFLSLFDTEVNDSFKLSHKIKDIGTYNYLEEIYFDIEIIYKYIIEEIDRLSNNNNDPNWREKGNLSMSLLAYFDKINERLNTLLNKSKEIQTLTFKKINMEKIQECKNKLKTTRNSLESTPFNIEDHRLKVITLVHSAKTVNENWNFENINEKIKALKTELKTIFLNDCNYQVINENDTLFSDSNRLESFELFELSNSLFVANQCFLSINLFINPLIDEDNEIINIEEVSIDVNIVRSFFI
jgi:hypothetical protein